jgi:hypothetical protein
VKGKTCDGFFVSGRVKLPEHLLEVCVTFTTHFVPTTDAGLALIELLELRRGTKSFGLLGGPRSAPEGVTGVFHSDGTDGKDALLGPSINNFFLEPAKLLVGTAVNKLKGNKSNSRFGRGCKETLLFALSRQIIDVYHKYGYSADQDFYPTWVQSLPSLPRYLRKRFVEANELDLPSEQLKAYIDTGELEDHVLEHKNGITPSFNMHGMLHLVALMMEGGFIQKTPNNFWKSTTYVQRGPLSHADYTNCVFKCDCLQLETAKLPDILQALSEHEGVLEDVERIIQKALDGQKIEAPAAQATPQARRSGRAHHQTDMYNPSPAPAPAPAPAPPPARPAKSHRSKRRFDHESPTTTKAPARPAKRRRTTSPVDHGSPTKKARSMTKKAQSTRKTVIRARRKKRNGKPEEEEEEEEESEEDDEESEEDDKDEESEEDDKEEESPPGGPTTAESAQSDGNGCASQPSSTTEGAPLIAGASAASNASGTEISSAPPAHGINLFLLPLQAAPATPAPSTRQQTKSPVTEQVEQEQERDPREEVEEQEKVQEEEKVEEEEAEEEQQDELTMATSAQRGGNGHVLQSDSTAEGQPLVAEAVVATESDSPGTGISMPEIPPGLKDCERGTDNETTCCIKTQTCIWTLDKKEHIWSVVLDGDGNIKKEEKEVLFQLMEMCHRGVSLVVKGLFNLPKDKPLLRTLRNASLPDAHLKVVRYKFNNESKTYTELASVNFMKTVDFVDYILERERKQMDGKSSNIEVRMYDRRNKDKTTTKSIPPEDLLYGFDLSMPEHYPKLFSELRNNCPIPEMFSQVSLNEQYVSARV